MNVSDKVALVTGTSRGIGPFIAKTLGAQGCTVVGVARNKAGLDQTVKDVEAQGGRAFAIEGDLLDLDGLPGLLDEVRNVAGSVDILVNNAGVEYYRHYAEYTARELASVITLNLHVPLELTRLLLPTMLEREYGHIVTIASLAGKKGVLYNGPYSATKAGVILWTDALRQELEGTPVGVSAILPGFIRDAGMFHGGGVTPPKLLGTSSPQDVADAVLEAILHDKHEVIVNPGPMRPMLALGQLSPSLSNTIANWMGVRRISEARRENETP